MKSTRRRLGVSAARGGIVVEYRTFRNTDTPRLVAVWNETFTQRGSPRLTHNTTLERYVLAKSIFDPRGLTVAEVDGEVAGWAHAAMSQNPFNTQPVGVVCLLGVRPRFQRQGIGTELLRRSEEYLRSQGAETLQAGGHWPNNPFYMGLYGGCDSPGFLKSDALAEPFFLKHDYRIDQKIIVLQHTLDQPMKMFDPRFLPLRNRFELQFGSPRRLLNWWQEAVHGYVDPLQFVLHDRQGGGWVARTLVWEMETFSAYWQRPTVGIFDFEVNPSYRRQSVGRYFLSLIMKYIQEQFFTLVELQMEDTNEAGLDFLSSLDFEHVDTGQVFVKSI
jgi:ribosomal protein S18 acetylase RimI-like enzyme